MPETPENINVVCAADDAYAMPLAVTLKSAGRSLDSRYRIRLFLLTGGFTDANWQRLESTLADLPIELHVIQPDVRLFSDLVISHHISHTAYFRLMTAEWVPHDVDKAIYLDSDLLLRDDLSQLWTQPVDDQFCLATMDIACPYVDARLGCQNFRKANPYMAALRPIPNYRQLKLDGSSEYFNSGVMVINVDLWRRDNIADVLLKTLRDNEAHVWCWDQYALNVVFHQNWRRFEPRWNQGAHVFEYPSTEHSPIEPELFEQMRVDPAIVHFTTEFKPWHVHSNHPRSEFFFDGLADTAWSEWAPDATPMTLHQRFDRGMLYMIKKSTVMARKFASVWPHRISEDAA